MGSKRYMINEVSSDKNESFEDSCEEEIFISYSRKKSKDKRHKKNESDSSDEDLTINGEFDFNDPNEDDYHSIKNIIIRTQYREIKNLKIDKFVDIICNQGNIGTTVTISNSVIAISTILNFRQYKHIMYSIVEFIRNITMKYHEKEFEEFFNSIIYEKNVGLMVNERLSNAPQELIPVLSRCLFDDIKWTIENLDTLVPKEERGFYIWDYIVLFSSRYSTSDNKSILYHKYEEQSIVDNSLHRVIWQSNKKQWCGSDSEKDAQLMRQEYVIAIIEYKKFEKLYFQSN